MEKENWCFLKVGDLQSFSDSNVLHEMLPAGTLQSKKYFSKKLYNPIQIKISVESLQIDLSLIVLICSREGTHLTFLETY